MKTITRSRLLLAVMFALTAALVVTLTGWLIGGDSGYLWIGTVPFLFFIPEVVWNVSESLGYALASLYWLPFIALAYGLLHATRNIKNRPGAAAVVLLISSGAFTLGYVLSPRLMQAAVSAAIAVAL